MQLEKQVCSLDLVKRLKELGVQQESLFYWCRPPESDDVYVCWYWQSLSTPTGETKDWEQIAAFTVAELGEMLPQGIECGKRKSGFACAPCHGWSRQFGDLTHRDMFEISFAPTEADARAKMLIYLLENKLITV